MREHTAQFLSCIPGLLTPGIFRFPLLLPLQGMLSVDYSGLLVLSLVALKKVSSDAEETRAALGAMQLTYASRIEELAQQVASLRSGAKAEVSSAPSSVLAAPSQSTSGIQLVAEAVTGCSDDDDAASLAFLADTGDVEMSSSRSGEEEVDAATSSGGEPPAGQLAGLTEVQVAEWLMAKLGEQAGARKMYLVRHIAATASLEASFASWRPALHLHRLSFAWFWHLMWACNLLCD